MNYKLADIIWNNDGTMAFEKPISIPLKTLEALKFLVDNYGNFEFDFSIIEKSLKALAIIKEKRIDVDLFYTIMEDENQIDKFWSYNFWQSNKNKLTKEEFEILKEVLL